MPVYINYRTKTKHSFEKNYCNFTIKSKYYVGIIKTLNGP